MKHTMKCKKVKLLLAPYILGDLAEDLKLLGQLETHLRNCDFCTGEYQAVRETIGFAEEYKDIFAEVFAEIDMERAGKASPQEQTLAKISTDSTQKPKSIQPFLRIGAAAACMVIGILTWLVFSNHSKPQTLTKDSHSQQVASVSKPSVKVELVRPSGNIAIEAGQAIVAGNELKTLLINGKHQMVMNADTSLSIEPLAIGSQLGCVVKLEKGEIFTHVEHDGNPFVVQTSKGKAVITGTTFNIKAGSQQTELVVSEGTVRFENENGSVNVKAGQKSTLTVDVKPTLPTLCDATKLTAWATGYKPDIAVAKAKSDADDWYLALSLKKDSIVLAETDYKSWIEEKRDWFKTNFPWIFELKDALAREGIEVDYPELLIRSGDAWQFACLDKFPARFSVPDLESLLKAATAYGFDKEWLLKNVPIAKTVQNKSLLLQNPTGLAALEQLLKYAKDIETMPYYLYPADACKYLAETRSLIWFTVQDGQYNLKDEEYVEFLDLLQHEVTTASNCCNDLLQQVYEQKKTLCGEDLCEAVEIKIFGYIEKIKNIEVNIAEYELYK